MTQVSIDIREPGEQHVVVAVAGEIDLATAPLVEGVLRWYTECDIIVDLSAVRLLDASGLTVLIRTQNRFRRTGHTLRTTGESGIVLAAMRITGLEDTFHSRI
jgi:anti-anti-sigma factor